MNLFSTYVIGEMQNKMDISECPKPRSFNTKCWQGHGTGMRFLHTVIQRSTDIWEEDLVVPYQTKQSYKIIQQLHSLLVTQRG